MATCCLFTSPNASSRDTPEAATRILLASSAFTLDFFEASTGVKLSEEGMASIPRGTHCITMRSTRIVLNEDVSSSREIDESLTDPWRNSGGIG